MRRFLSVLILLLASLPAWSANDFTSDANCVGAYMEDVITGGVMADAMGLNNLTNQTATIDTDAADHVEGIGAGYFNAAGAGQWRSDADLTASHPFKSTYSGTRRISIVLWMKLVAYPASISFMVTKGKNLGAYAAAFFNMEFIPVAAAGQIRVRKGYANFSWDTLQHPYDLELGHWYHVGYTYNDTDKSWKLRVWDAEAAALLGGVETSGTADHNWIKGAEATGSPKMWIAQDDYSATNSKMWLDEIGIFNDVLTSDEIDTLRAGTYGSATNNDFWWRRRHSNGNKDESGNPVYVGTDLALGGDDCLSALQIWDGDHHLFWDLRQQQSLAELRDGPRGGGRACVPGWGF